MKPLLLTLALVGLGSAADAQDWGGAYVGLQTASADSPVVFYGIGIPKSTPYPAGGHLNGVIAGYAHQAGNLVFGGEIAYLSGVSALDQHPATYFSDMLDLKLRAGYSFGRILPYATVGFSKSTWNNNKLIPVDADGIAFGFGAEFQATDRIVVGLEYLNRNIVADEIVEFPTDINESDFSTVSLRVAFKF